MNTNVKGLRMAGASLGNRKKEEESEKGVFYTSISKTLKKLQKSIISFLPYSPNSPKLFVLKSLRMISYTF